VRRIVALSLVVLVAAPFAAARASVSTAMATDATLSFDGHGWGHGRGMGQYGARGKAEAGKTFDQILSAYYSGVTMGTRAAEDIRVLVEESQDVVLTSQGTFSVAWQSGGAVGTSDDTYRFFRVRKSGSGYAVDRATQASGPWATLGTSSSYAIATPASGSLIEVVLDSGKVRIYRGSIEARVGGTENLMRAINVLTVEYYVNAVVPNEMPSSWPAEALKAQSVAARTYGIYKKIGARASGTMFDICATTSCQVYSGFGWRPAPDGTLNKEETAATASAISATAGKVLLYNGSPILAEYSSSTGGYTAPGSVPYEKAVPDPEDAVSPNHSWTASVAVSSIEARWPAIGRLVSIDVTKRNGYGDWGGRVLELRLTGTQSSVTISGSSFSGAFEWPSRSDGLRSSWFRIGDVIPGVVGLHRDASWYLHRPGATTSFVFGRASDKPITGDWDGNGTATVGLFREGLWYLDNNNDGHSDRSFAFGRSTDKPVTGDWNNDKKTTVGVVRGNLWYLDDGNDGHSDRTIAFGRSTDTPLTGDWDGNGTTTIGVFRGGVWYLDNNNDGRADLAFAYGSPTDKAITGDWDGNATTTVGVVRGNLWLLRNANASGDFDLSFAFGRSTDQPITGDWDGPTAS
jgi:SpoIID/LytB domain protein